MEGLSYNKKSILEKTDTTPTANSTNNVTSGGVKTYVDAADAVLQGEITNLENRLTNPFTYKGSVAAVGNLPSSGNTLNDVYFVEAENCLYAWNGSAWGKSSTNDYEKILGELAAAFDAAKVYKKGELVLYNDGVWVRKADATQADGSWVAANWTATDLGTEIANVNNALKYLHKSEESTRVFERGLFDYSTGATTGGTLYLRTTSNIVFDTPILITLADTVLVKAFFYDIDGNFISYYPEGTDWSLYQPDMLYLAPGESALPINARFVKLVITTTTRKNFASYTTAQIAQYIAENVTVRFIESDLKLNRFGKSVSTGQDLNELVIPGTYLVTSYTTAASLQHYPLTSTGRIIVISGDSGDYFRVIQLVVSSVVNTIYYRIGGYYVSGGSTVNRWQDWRRILTDYSRFQTLSVLAIGNSSDTDAFAYVPPVLLDIIPTLNINVATLYNDSYSNYDHIEAYNNGTVYTHYNEWNSSTGRWDQLDIGTANQQTLTSALQRKPWDIIVFRGKGSNWWTSYQKFYDEVIINGRHLMNLVSSSLSQKHRFLAMPTRYPTSYSTLHPSWYTGEEDFCIYINKEVTKLLGIDVIPTNVAMYNAITVSDLQDITDHHDMTYEGTHYQAGIPDLISAYTIALKLLQYAVPSVDATCIGCTWEPTDENCIAIRTRVADVMKYRMTHGASAGMGAEVKLHNMYLAQLVAQAAIDNPMSITDFSILDDPVVPDE